MTLSELIQLQAERLQAAADVFRALLAEHRPGTSAFEALDKHLRETKQELRERRAFTAQVEDALEACRSYRLCASAVAFARMRESYDLLFVRQQHPLARRHLPKLEPLGARAGCRSCAGSLLEKLEKHLNAPVQDDYPQSVLAGAVRQ